MRRPNTCFQTHACRYYQSKEQLLAAMGFGSPERFPVYSDRFPIQLLAYLRLSRIQVGCLGAVVMSDLVCIAVFD